MYLVRHEADEVTETQRRFQHTALREAKVLHQRIHGPDDDRRGVMGVERSGAGRLQFVLREQRLQSFTLFLPLLIPSIEHLRQAAPADLAHQNLLLRLSRWPLLRFELLQQLDGGQIRAALLLQRPSPNFVRLRDAVIVLITPWLRFGRRRLIRDDGGGWFYSSGGRKR